MRPHKKNPPAAVYRHLNAAGETLYIGCSINPMARFNGHRSQSPWALDVSTIKIVWFPNLDDALAEEKRLIKLENPPNNREFDSGPYKREHSNGPAILRKWMEEFNVSERFLGMSLGGNRATAENLLKINASPRLRKQHQIAVATSGLVPQDSWDRYKKKPVILANKKEAKFAFEEAKERLEFWGEFQPAPIAAHPRNKTGAA